MIGKKQRDKTNPRSSFPECNEWRERELTRFESQNCGRRSSVTRGTDVVQEDAENCKSALFAGTLHRCWFCQQSRSLRESTLE